MGAFGSIQSLGEIEWINSTLHTESDPPPPSITSFKWWITGQIIIMVET